MDAFVLYSDRPSREENRLKQQSVLLGRPVVVLADLPHRHQRLQVLVGLVRVDVVQGAAVPGIPVGGREVDGYLRRRQPIRDQSFGFSLDGTCASDSWAQARFPVECDIVVGWFWTGSALDP